MYIELSSCERKGLIPPGTDPGFGASPVATHYVEVGDNLEPAIASLEAHHAYNDVLPDDFPKPRELVTMILGMSAPATGHPYSVSFEVLEA